MPWTRASTLLLAAVTAALAVVGAVLAAAAGTGPVEPLLWSGPPSRSSRRCC